MPPSLINPVYVVPRLVNAETVKTNAVFSPEVWMNGAVLDGSSWTSALERIRQLELQNARVTNMELKLTSLIASVRTILIYLNQLKIAVELLDETGADVNPPPVPPT